MCAFVNDCVLDSGVPIENDSSRSTFHIVDGCLNECSSDCEGNGCSVNAFEKVGHFDIFVYSESGMGSAL